MKIFLINVPGSKYIKGRNEPKGNLERKGQGNVRERWKIETIQMAT